MACSLELGKMARAGRCAMQRGETRVAVPACNAGCLAGLRGGVGFCACACDRGSRGRRAAAGGHGENGGGFLGDGARRLLGVTPDEGFIGGLNLGVGSKVGTYSVTRVMDFLGVIQAVTCGRSLGRGVFEFRGGFCMEIGKSADVRAGMENYL